MREPTSNHRRTLALAVGGVLVLGAVLGRRSLSGRASGGAGGCEGSDYRPPGESVATAVKPLVLTDASDGEGGLVPCTPAVLVIRHAEDMDSAAGEQCIVGETSLEVPGGVQKVHQRCLTPNGATHAKLYAAKLAGWMQTKNFCPAGRIITQDPWGTGGAWPSANPFETIRELAMAKQLPITFMPSSTVFDLAVRRSLITDATRSVVVAWDKEGLWDAAAPLLKQMTDAPASFPTRDMLYAFTSMNADTAKYDLKEYKQFFADSSGYFAKVVGSAFAEASYYRFDDGSLKSLEPYSPDLAPSDMIVCGGSSCDGQGVTLQSASRK
jgi:hypothetical protein